MVRWTARKEAKAMETRTTTSRSVTLGLRVSPEVKAKLVELAELMGAAMGTKITQSQALEAAITEAVNARRGS